MTITIAETVSASALLDVGAQFMRDQYGEASDRIELPYSVWGDYVGGIVERANAQYLSETYPDHVHTYYAGYGAEVCYVQADAEIPSALLDDIASLQDYPLLCESALSEVEQAVMDDDLMSWVWSDFRFGLERGLEDAAIPAYPADDEPLSDEAIAALFSRAYPWDEHYPICETANSAHWAGLEQSIATAVALTLAEREQAWSAYALSLGVIPGQTALSI